MKLFGMDKLWRKQKRVGRKLFKKGKEEGRIK